MHDEPRRRAADTLAKLIGDKLTGPRIRLILQRFVPPLFVDAMCENSEAAVATFEGTYETPELIWNVEARKRVCSALARMAARLHARQTTHEASGGEHRWTILQDLQV